MEQKNTTNLYLGAAFLLTGSKLIKIDRADPAHVDFRFEGKFLDQTKSLFNMSMLQGDLKKYSQYILILKQELRDD